MAETLYFRYGRGLDEVIDLDNVQDIHSLDKIPLTWIVDWDIDGRRGFWGQTIVKKISKCIWSCTANGVGSVHEKL